MAVLLLLLLKLLLASLEAARCCRNEPAEVGGEAAEASGEEEEEEEEEEEGEDGAADVQTAPGDCRVSARRNAAASPRRRGDGGGDAPLGEEDTTKPRAAIAKISLSFFINTPRLGGVGPTYNMGTRNGLKSVPGTQRIIQRVPSRWVVHFSPEVYTNLPDF